MNQMHKEEFIVLLDRQRSSELSIKDFCTNEACTEPSFYSWKSKFGYSRSYRTHPTDASTGKFGRVSFIAPADATIYSQHTSSNPGEKVQDVQEEICIELPGGVSIRFKGEIRSDLTKN